MKLTTEQLMERYPLHTYFPQGGEHYVLLVHTESEQQQFLVSRTEQGLHGLLAAKLKNVRAVALTVRELWRCEMVMAPFWVRKLYAEHRHRQLISDFVGRVTHAAEEYDKAAFPLPPGIKKCEYKVLHEDWMDEEGWQPSEDDVRYHTSCVCRGRGYLITVDEEELYLAKHEIVDRWAATAHPYSSYGTRPQPPRPTPKPFQGWQAANPERTLYVGIPQHGHHSSGNVIQELVQKDEYLPFSVGGYDMPLFFCHGEKLCSQPLWAKKMLEAEKEKDRLAERAVQRANHERNKKFNETKFRMLEAVFDVKRGT